MVYIEIPRSAAWGCTALTDPSAIEAFRARVHEGFSRDWKPSAWSLRVKLVTLFAAVLAAAATFLVAYFPARMDEDARNSMQARGTVRAAVTATHVHRRDRFDI